MAKETNIANTLGAAAGLNQLERFKAETPLSESPVAFGGKNEGKRKKGKVVSL